MAIRYKCWYYKTAVEAGTEDVYNIKPGYIPQVFNEKECNSVKNIIEK